MRVQCGEFDVAIEIVYLSQKEEIFVPLRTSLILSLLICH